jgi:hypothetical protein
VQAWLDRERGKSPKGYGPGGGVKIA